MAEELQIPPQTISNSQSFTSESKITATGVQVVQPGSLELKAAREIRLRATQGQEFRVSQGLQLIASIGPVPPDAPKSLAAEQRAGYVHLTWTDCSRIETAYVVDRKTGANGNYATRATIAPNSTYFDDSAIQNGVTYYYRVRAANAVGSSKPSGEVAVTIAPTAAVSIAAIPPVCGFTGYSVLRVTRTGDISQDLIVNLGLSGSAVEDVDFVMNSLLNGSITIPAGASFYDARVYGISTQECYLDVEVTGGPGYWAPQPANATVVFVPVASAWVAQVTQQGDKQAGTIRIERMGPMEGSLNVNFTLSHSSERGTDFILTYEDGTPLNGDVAVIPSAQNAVTIRLARVGDFTIDKTVDLELCSAYDDVGGALYTIVAPSIGSVILGGPLPNTGSGLLGEYFGTLNLSSGAAPFNVPKTSQVEAQIDFDWTNSSPPGFDVNSTGFSARWIGQIEAQYSETYSFFVTADNGVRLWINNNLVIDSWASGGVSERQGNLQMTAGQRAGVRLEYTSPGNGQIKLEWSSASTSRETVPQTRLYAETGLACTIALESTVSPLCVEGLAWDTHGGEYPVVVSGEGLAVPARFVNDHCWFANVALRANAATQVTASSPLSSTNRAVRWIATDLNGRTVGTNDIMIRKGDSLLWTVSGGTGPVGIDADGDGNNDFAGMAGGTFSFTYLNAGTYVVTGTLAGVTAGSARVYVLEANLDCPIAAQINYSRIKDVPVGPSAAASGVMFYSGDPVALTTSTVGPHTDSLVSGTRITLEPLKRGTPVVIARLGGPTGSILSAQTIEEFLLVTTLSSAATRDPSSSAIKTLLRIEPYVADLDFYLDMEAAGATFIGGAGSIVINTSKFSRAYDNLHKEDAGEFVLWMDAPIQTASYSFSIQLKQTCIKKELAAAPEIITGTISASPGTNNSSGTIPIANADHYSTPLNVDLEVDAPGVLSNDTGTIQTLTAALCSAPTHGNLILHQDGSFVYSPAAGYWGYDGFTYVANDGLSSRESAVLIYVQPAAQVQGAARYWVAQNDSNWNLTTNWSTSSGGAGGASVPDGGNLVFFDRNGTGSCTVTGDAASLGLRIDAEYTGVVQAGTGIIFTVGVGGYFQYGGRLHAADAALTFLGDATFNGGSCRLSSGTTSIHGALTYNAGELAANGGTVVFSMYSTISATGHLINLNRVRIAGPAWGGISIEPETSMMVNEELICTSGRATGGILLLRGDASIASTWTGGDSVLKFIAERDQNISGPGAHDGRLVVQKPDTSKVIATGGALGLLGGVKVESGTLRSTADPLKLSGIFEIESTFDAADGALQIVGPCKIKAHKALQFNRLTVASSPGDTVSMNLITGKAIHVRGAMELQRGQLLCNNVIEAEGDVTIHAAFDGMRAALALTGSADQSLSAVNGAAQIYEKLTIDKFSGTCTIDGEFDCFADLALERGALDATGAVLAMKGARPTRLVGEWMVDILTIDKSSGSVTVWNDIQVSQSLSITSGTLILRDDHFLKLGGDVFISTGAALQAAKSAVVLNGHGAQQVSLNHQNVFSLAIDNQHPVSFMQGFTALSDVEFNPGSIVEFAYGESFDFESLKAEGTEELPIEMRSTHTTLDWNLKVRRYPAIFAWVHVKGSRANQEHTLYAVDSHDLGNNHNWRFIGSELVSFKTSPISQTNPAWVEGKCRIDVRALQLKIGNSAAEPAPRLGRNLWFAGNTTDGLGVTLSANGPTRLVATAQVGEREMSVSQDLTWAPIDLRKVKSSSNNVLIRRNDALLFTCGGNGTQLVIDADGDGSDDFLGDVGAQYPFKYQQTGSFIAKAKVDGAEVGSLVVTVVDVGLGGATACEVGYSATRDVSIRPFIAYRKINFYENDSDILKVENLGRLDPTVVDETGQAIDVDDLYAIAKVRVGFSVLKRGVSVLLARLNGSTGPIVSYQIIDDFTLDLAAAREAQISTYNDTGSSLVVMRPYIPDLTLKLEMFAHSSTFLGGAPTLTVNSSGTYSNGKSLFTQFFDDHTGEIVGLYYPDLEVPPNEMMYCFNATMLQPDGLGGKASFPTAANGSIKRFQEPYSAMRAGTRKLSFDAILRWGMKRADEAFLPKPPPLPDAVGVGARARAFGGGSVARALSTPRAVSVRAAPAPVKHLLTIKGGTGSGKYAPGDVVTITVTDEDSDDYEFDEWEMEEAVEYAGNIASKSARSTTFQMPPKPAKIHPKPKRKYKLSLTDAYVSKGNKYVQTMQVKEDSYIYIHPGQPSEGSAFTGWAINGTFISAPYQDLYYKMPGSKSGVAAQYEVIQVGPASIPNARVGQPYNQLFNIYPSGLATYISVMSTAQGQGLQQSGNSLVGVPLQAGTTSIDVRVIAPGNNAKDFIIPFIVDPPLLAITPNPMPSANVGVAYASKFESGSPDYKTWSMTPVPGFSLAPSTGMLTGTASQPGKFDFTVTVNDPLGNKVSEPRSLNVNPKMNPVNPQLLASAGSPFNYQFSCDDPNYINFFIGSGDPNVPLPPWISMVNRILTGVAPIEMDVPLLVSCDLPRGGGFSKLYVLHVGPNQIATTALASAELGQIYSFQMTATSPATWSMSPAVPGLSMSSSGLLTGTPTQDNIFDVQVSAVAVNGSWSSKKPFRLVVAKHVVVLNDASFSAQRGQPVNWPLLASFGVPPYTWSINGTLPSQLAVTGNAITGAAMVVPGNYSFTIKVTDSVQATATKDVMLNLDVPPPLQISTTQEDIPYAATTLPYDFSFASNGISPLTWTLDPVINIPGMTLDTHGRLSGTPTTVGTYALQLKVVDVVDALGTKNFTLKVTVASQVVLTSAQFVTSQCSGIQLVENSTHARAAIGAKLGIQADPGPMPYFKEWQGAAEFRTQPSAFIMTVPDPIRNWSLTATYRPAQIFVDHIGSYNTIKREVFDAAKGAVVNISSACVANAGVEDPPPPLDDDNYAEYWISHEFLNWYAVAEGGAGLNTSYPKNRVCTFTMPSTDVFLTAYYHTWNDPDNPPTGPLGIPQGDSAIRNLPTAAITDLDMLPGTPVKATLDCTIVPINSPLPQVLSGYLRFYNVSGGGDIKVGTYGQTPANDLGAFSDFVLPDVSPLGFDPPYDKSRHVGDGANHCWHKATNRQYAFLSSTRRGSTVLIQAEMLPDRGEAISEAAFAIHVRGLDKLTCTDASDTFNTVTVSGPEPSNSMLIRAGTTMSITGVVSDTTKLGYRWRVDGDVSVHGGTFDVPGSVILPSYATSVMVKAGYDLNHNSVLEDDEVIRTINVDTYTSDFTGGHTFGCVKKGVQVTLPDINPPDATNRLDYKTRLDATHLFFPADGNIDANANQAFIVLNMDSLNPAFGAKLAVKDTMGRVCTKISDYHVFEGSLWDALRAKINATHSLFGLNPVTAQSMFNDLKAEYGTDVADGKHFLSPAYTDTGNISPIKIYLNGKESKNPKDVYKIAIKTPITIKQTTSSFPRFSKYEAEIQLDDHYFHHLTSLDQAHRFDAYDAGIETIQAGVKRIIKGEKIAVDVTFRRVEIDQNCNSTSITSINGKLQEYVVPCFAMKEGPDKPFKWLVRFSPPVDTIPGAANFAWEVSARAVVYHKSSHESDILNYDEYNTCNSLVQDGDVANPDLNSSAFYHYYGYNDYFYDGVQTLAHPGNQHNSIFQNVTLPLPRQLFYCASSNLPGFVRKAKPPPDPAPSPPAPKPENQAYLYYRKADGSDDALFILGAAKPWDTQYYPPNFMIRDWTGSPTNSPMWVDWKDQDLFSRDDLLEKMKGAMNFDYVWFAPWECQLVHNKSRSEFWYENNLRKEYANKVPMGEWTGYNYFDQGRAARMDEIVTSHELKNIYLGLSIWPHQSLQYGHLGTPPNDYFPNGEVINPPGSHNWGEWGWNGKPLKEEENGFSSLDSELDNFFMAASDEFGVRWLYQKAYYRYVIARWGYSRVLAMWVAVDELEGVGKDSSYWWTFKDSTHPWHDAMINTIRDLDCFNRAITTSTTAWIYNRDPYQEAESPKGNWIGNPDGAKIDLRTHHAYHMTYYWDQDRNRVWQGMANGYGANWGIYQHLDSLNGAHAAIWHALCGRMFRWVQNTSTGIKVPWLVTEYGLYERDFTYSPLDKGLVRSYLHFANWSALASGHTGTPFKWADGLNYGDISPRGDGPFSPNVYPDLVVEMKALWRFINGSTDPNNKFDPVPLSDLEERKQFNVNTPQGSASTVRCWALASHPQGETYNDYVVAWLFDDDCSTSNGPDWGSSPRTYTSDQKASKQTHQVLFTNLAPSTQYVLKRFNTWDGNYYGIESVMTDATGRLLVPVGIFPTATINPDEAWDGADCIIYLQKF